jgi:hypothetical protein
MCRVALHAQKSYPNSFFSKGHTFDSPRDLELYMWLEISSMLQIFIDVDNGFVPTALFSSKVQRHGE